MRSSKASWVLRYVILMKTSAYQWDKGVEIHVGVCVVFVAVFLVVQTRLVRLKLKWQSPRLHQEHQATLTMVAGK